MDYRMYKSFDHSTRAKPTHWICWEEKSDFTIKQCSHVKCVAEANELLEDPNSNFRQRKNYSIYTART